MNTIIHQAWNADLYLDALGSVAVIAAGALIFLFAAAVTIVAATPWDLDVAEACPVTHVAMADYADKRPGFPPAPQPVACI